MDPEYFGQFASPPGHQFWTYTTVEAVPSDPENAGTDHHQAYIVRLEIFSIVLQSRANPVRTSKSSSSRAQVNDIPA